MIFGSMYCSGFPNQNCRKATSEISMSIFGLLLYLAHFQEYGIISCIKTKKF